MSNEKIIDNNDEMRLDGMSEVNIDKMVDASEHHLIDDEEVRMLMDELEKACAEKFSEDDMARLKKAMNFAYKAHLPQKRESGEPYIIHPLAVAKMLFEMGMDTNTVIAGLLHDVVEDCDGITVEDIAREFGTDIAEMVDGVTKLTKTGKSDIISKEEAQAENLRKMFLAIAKDVRVVIIKLTDRLHNMRTLEYCKPEKRQRKAREVLDVYAPLASRFGMGAIKCEMEDLAFHYLMPEEYAALEKQIEPQRRERMLTLNKAIKTIEEQLAAAGIQAQVNGRPKHLYSIYKKFLRQNRSLAEIYDLIAVRVIVNTINDCYAALGIIHSIWKPVPGRFKDYIAMPKTNMYRSLHTTLFSDTGLPFEVQIRTYEMHRTSEYGIAAHWMYKEGRANQDELDSKLAWLREALELENYADTTKEFVESIRKDFFSDYVYVLTPRGQIIDLVTGSTPLDFAYRIHSNVGNHVQHAKVNGAIVRLDYKLKNNDVCEIVTAPNATPSRDWLKIVKTQQAKAKIRQWFKKANREENIIRGKEMLSEAAKRQGRQLGELTKKSYYDDLLERFNMNDIEDIYAAIGYGGVTATRVANRLRDELARSSKTDKKTALDKVAEAAERREQKAAKEGKAIHGILVQGIDNCLVKFSRCCTPVPGDDIVGFITRGQGVSIHRRDCENYQRSLAHPEESARWINVSWAHNITDSYVTSLAIASKDRSGLVMDIATVLNSINAKVRTLSARDIGAGQALVNVSLEVRCLADLKYIMSRLASIPGVSSVTRNGK